MASGLWRFCLLALALIFGLERRYDKAMVSRLAVLCMLLAVSSFAQTPSTTTPPALRMFHDPALDITFGFPGEFTPVVADPAKAQPATKGDKGEPQCVRSVLTAGSESKLGSSAFVISVIDSACPSVLKQAQQPGSFTRDQILRQLKTYGAASLTQEPFRYTIDGRQAAVTLAMAEPNDTTMGMHKATTYAAKACFFSNVPAKSSGKQGAAMSDQVICFDYTTQNRELMTRILSFTVKFSDQETHPVVPGNAVR